MERSSRPGRFASSLFLCFALVVMLGATACAARSDYMLEIKSPRAVVIPPGMAMVVFVRPSGWAPVLKVTILDEHGAFLGDSLPSSQFAVSLAAGPHVFITWAENTAALQALLVPGRTYFVEVSPKVGMFGPRVHLLGITPRTESWSRLGDWLADTRQFTPDPVGGQASLQERAEEVSERMRRGQEVLREYDAEELEARTIRPEDGR